MCECCPPLPYCGFGALVKIEFYVVDMFMERFDFYHTQQEVLPGEGEGQDVRMLSTASVLRLRGTCQD